MKVKSESEVTQSCLTLRNPVDCGLPGSFTHGIFQARARVLEWGAIAFEYKFGASHVALVVKNLSVNAGDLRESGSIPGSGRSPGGGHGNPLQYSYLENPMDSGLKSIRSQSYLAT